jgi:hypothetical protein
MGGTMNHIRFGPMVREETMSTSHWVLYRAGVWDKPANGTKPVWSLVWAIAPSCYQTTMASNQGRKNDQSQQSVNLLILPPLQ